MPTNPKIPLLTGYLEKWWVFNVCHLIDHDYAWKPPFTTKKNMKTPFFVMVWGVSEDKLILLGNEQPAKSEMFLKDFPVLFRSTERRLC